MKTLLLTCLSCFLSFYLSAQNNNLTSTSTEFEELDSLFIKSLEMSLEQTDKLLEEFFIVELDENGKAIYTPKMVQFQSEKAVMIPLENNQGFEEEIQIYKFEIPLITLSSIQFYGIENAIIEDQHLTITTKESPAPIGFNILIEILSKQIGVLQVDNP